MEQFNEMLLYLTELYHILGVKYEFGPSVFYLFGPPDWVYSTRGRFHKKICALRPTFEKLFTGVERALRHAPNFYRAISMICALRPTFMKSTPARTEGLTSIKLLINKSSRNQLSKLSSLLKSENLTDL